MLTSNDIEHLISEIKKLLINNKYQNFNEYLHFLETESSHGSCNKSWYESVLIARCENCALSSNSCICLDCFLRGDHKNHNYQIYKSSNGSCDCGNSMLWKKEGFCIHHSENKSIPEKKLPKDDVDNILSLFDLLIELFFYLIPLNQVNSKIENISALILDLVRTGDNVRHLFAISFEKNFNWDQFINFSFTLSKSTMNSFITLLGTLINDLTFRRAFSHYVVTHIVDLAKKSYTSNSSSGLNQNSSFRKLIKFIFHGFSSKNLQEQIDKGLDWIKISMEILNVSFEFLMLKDFQYVYYRKAKFELFLHHAGSLIKSGLLYDKEHQLNFIHQMTMYLAQVDFSNPIDCQPPNSEKLNDFFYSSLSQYFFSHQIYSIIQSVADNDITSIEPFHQLANQFSKINFYQQNTIYSPQNSFSFFSLLIPLHIFAYQLLPLNPSTNIPLIFSEIAQKHKMSLKTFTEKLIKGPLMIYSAYLMNFHNAFVRNPETFISCLHDLNHPFQRKIFFIPLISLIQISLGSATDIKQMIIDILVCFLPENLFEFFFCISCLIFDRSCLTKDFQTMHRLNFITMLKREPYPCKDLKKLWGMGEFNPEEIMYEINSFAKQIDTSTGPKIKITNDSEWHPVIPYVFSKYIFEHMASFIQKNPNGLINFPDFIPEAYGLDLKSVLMHPALFAVEYHCLSGHLANDPLCSSESLQFVYRLLISQNKFNTFIPKTNDEENYNRAKFEKYLQDSASILSLMDQLNGISFRNFLYKKINYKQRGEKSIIDLLHDLRGAALHLLKMISINEENNTINDEETKAKERAQKLRKTIMEDFKKQIDSFVLPSDDNDNIEENFNQTACNICQETFEPLYYPAFYYKSCFPSYILNTEPKPVILFRICQHTFHKHCLENVQNQKCPICNMLYRLKIPVNNLDQNSSELANIFSDIYEHHLMNIFETISSELIILETRTRYSTDVLKKVPDFITLQNEWKIIKTFIKQSIIDTQRLKQYRDKQPQKLVLFLTYIAENLSVKDALIESNIINEMMFKEINIPNTNENTDFNNSLIELLSILKQIVIFKHFCLKDEINMIDTDPDWDIQLQTDEILKQYYNDFPYLVKYRTFFPNTLPEYLGAKVPDDFIHFILPPYNINIANFKLNFLIRDLFTGQVLTMPQNNNIEIFFDIFHDSDSDMRFFLFLNGINSSKVFCLNLHLGLIRTFSPFYLTKTGDPNIGYITGAPIFLDKQALRKTFDKIFGFDWLW